MTQLERFETFWREYPHRVGKLAARRSFDRAKVDDELLATMLGALAWQKTQEQWKRGYIPHPTTWLNQGRWLDEPLNLSPASSREPSAREMSDAKDLLRRWGRCLHDPAHDDWRECVRAIALGRES
jgi:hypothetical protein